MFQSCLEKRVVPIATKIATQRHLVAMRDGIILAMPVMIIGSMFIVLFELPIPQYQNLMMSIFGDSWA